MLSLLAFMALFFLAPKSNEFSFHSFTCHLTYLLVQANPHHYPLSLKVTYVVTLATAATLVGLSVGTTMEAFSWIALGGYLFHQSRGTSKGTLSFESVLLRAGVYVSIPNLILR